MTYLAREYNVVVTKYGRMSDCEIYTKGSYETALMVAKEYQAQYRNNGVLTGLINLVSKDGSSPFDIDNNFLAKDGVTIEISAGRMKEESFPFDKEVLTVVNGELSLFPYSGNLYVPGADADTAEEDVEYA